MAEGFGTVILGITGFIGAKFVENQAQNRQISRTLSDSVLELTFAVKSAGGELEAVKKEISNQVGSLKDEIHTQVSSLRNEIHDQVEGLKDELKESRTEYRERLASIDKRMDVVTLQSNQNREIINEYPKKTLDL
jgi:predicted amino acid-binding ACT domain protein